MGQRYGVPEVVRASHASEKGCGDDFVCGPTSDITTRSRPSRGRRVIDGVHEDVVVLDFWRRPRRQAKAGKWSAELVGPRG